MNDEKMEREFWKEVSSALGARRAALSGRQISYLVDDYRERLLRNRVGNLIYHDAPKEVADAIYRSRKFASEHPLPGGENGYFDTLLDILNYVGEGSRPIGEVRSELSRKTQGGQRAMDGYIGSISRMGLWRQTDGRSELMPLGRKIIELGDKARRRKTLDIKLGTVQGYDVLFRSLANGRASLRELDEVLKSSLGLSWKSINQSDFRVNWLRSLGYVEGPVTALSLTHEGREISVELLNGVELALS